MSVVVRKPWERAEGKIQPWHRDRVAVVYVRQSTPGQVKDHQESTRLQYGLVERAYALGWAASRVLVIDEDLGQSASGAVERTGFSRLVAEVGLSRVGIVLGVEMSRLARSGREWHQLLELCALSGALLGDPDGVYDPAEHNDRLLLGLKGTISEAELYLIKQRMWSGRIAKARRGELAVPLPSGFVRGRDGLVALDPDEQVQSVIHVVFDLFDRLRTVNAVLCFLADNQVQIGTRVRGGARAGDLVWSRPSRTGLQNILRNPAYAGIYAYGRSTLDARRRQPGRPYTGRVRVEREEWLVYLPGVMPAYISIERYESNMRRLEANRSRAQSQGAVRDGPALLAGLVVCARCGKKMSVRYQRSQAGKITPQYVCTRNKSLYAESSCQSLAGTCVDDHVTAVMLAALAPAALEISLAAAEQAETQRAQIERIWAQRLERAEYAVERARRQYQLAEPENRLVVRQLEKDWEAALAERECLVREHEQFTATRPRMLSPAERDQIRALAQDVPAIWNAPSTTMADRKQLIRLLVEQVRVAVHGTSEKVDVELAWAGGHVTTAQIVRPVAALTQLTYYPQLVERARALADDGATGAQIAAALNSEGYRPPKRAAEFTTEMVLSLLRSVDPQRARSPRQRPELAEHEWWLRDLANHIGMSEITLDGWVRRGWVTGYLHPEAGLRIVRADPAEVERLRALHQVPRGQHNRRPWLEHQATSINDIEEGEPDDETPAHE
jgi:DNA invertase Pin-like site-specific DNA recombinase